MAARHYKLRIPANDQRQILISDGAHATFIINNAERIIENETIQGDLHIQNQIQCTENRRHRHLTATHKNNNEKDKDKEEDEDNDEDMNRDGENGSSRRDRFGGNGNNNNNNNNGGGGYFDKYDGVGVNPPVFEMGNIEHKLNELSKLQNCLQIKIDEYNKQIYKTNDLKYDILLRKLNDINYKLTNNNIGYDLMYKQLCAHNMVGLDGSNNHLKGINKIRNGIKYNNKSHQQSMNKLEKCFENNLYLNKQHDDIKSDNIKIAANNTNNRQFPKRRNKKSKHNNNTFVPPLEINTKQIKNRTHSETNVRNMNESNKCSNNLSNEPVVPMVAKNNKKVRKRKRNKNYKQYRCLNCMKNFNHRSNYYPHVRICGEKPTFECNECDKAFHEQKKLVQHKRIHTGEKPFKCHICHRSYAQKKGWNNHMKKKHKVIYQQQNKKYIEHKI